jgi:serine/threonine-protein phosphatase 2A regulatory subunit A
MIKQLAQWDHYNSRISATSLLATCYDRVSDLEKSDIIQMITDLSKDDTPMVRRGVA